MGHISADTLNEIQRRDARNKEAEEKRKKELAKARKKLEEIMQPFGEFEIAAQEAQRDAFRNFLTSLLESYTHFEAYHEVMTKRTLNAARKKDTVKEWLETSDIKLPHTELPTGKPHDGKWPEEIRPTYRDHMLRWYKLIESGAFPAVAEMDDGELSRWWRRKL